MAVLTRSLNALLKKEVNVFIHINHGEIMKVLLRRLATAAVAVKVAAAVVVAVVGPAGTRCRR